MEVLRKAMPATYPTLRNATQQHRPLVEQKVGKLEIKAAIRDLLAERYYFKQFET
jgi:hypothetical protein